MTPKILPTCCECSHFRMWKPIESYCTVKKEAVDPLCEAVCGEYKLRGNIKEVYGPIVKRGRLTSDSEGQNSRELKGR